jgi:hypothetical protein
LELNNRLEFHHGLLSLILCIDHILLHVPI